MVFRTFIFWLKADRWRVLKETEERLREATKRAVTVLSPLRRAGAVAMTMRAIAAATLCAVAPVRI